jgi:hypothetical protein
MDLGGLKEVCGRCDGPLGWVDDRWVCGEGVTLCTDCRDEVGGVCPDCSDALRRQRSAKPIGH